MNELHIPDGVFAAVGEALEQNGLDDIAYATEIAEHAVTVAAPLIAAAELRMIANLVIADDEAGDVVEMLRTRATELEGGTA